MGHLTVRLSEEYQQKLLALIDNAGGRYNPSDVIGAAITMASKLELDSGEKPPMVNPITLQRLGSAYYFYRACVDEKNSKLIRNLEIQTPDAGVTVIIPPKILVRAIPPNIIEFGPPDNVVIRLLVYPSLEIYTTDGKKINSSDLRPGTGKLKIIVR